MRNLAPKFFGTENVKMSNGEMNEFIVLGWLHTVDMFPSHSLDIFRKYHFWHV